MLLDEGLELAPDLGPAALGPAGEDRLQPVVARVGEIGVEPALDLGLGQGADELGHHLAAVEHLDGRDAADVELLGDLGLLVRVELDELPAPRGRGGQLLDDRSEHAARSAPRSPEVDHHRHSAAALDHGGDEVDRRHRTAL